MKASVIANRDFTIADIDDRLYGAFLEHLGRAIYTGIYEPGSSDRRRRRHARRRHRARARTQGRRSCAIPAAISSPPTIGRTASARARSGRPASISPGTRRNPTPSACTSSRAGARPSGREMMLAINLGSRGLDEARNFVEYVNGPTGSYWGDLRKAHGRAEPFGVKHWCLGNEMDGPWQVGHKTAHEYGRLANEVAKTLRAFDKSLELIVCGSSHSDMKTYPEWERVVLEHTYERVDHISLHMYFANPREEHRQLSRAQRKARRLYRRGRVDHRTRARGQAVEEARHDLLRRMERLVSFQRAGSRHPRRPARAGRMRRACWRTSTISRTCCRSAASSTRSSAARTWCKIACIAQLVNVIAPIMTEPGGPAWRQTIYYPYHFASIYGRGVALRLDRQIAGLRRRSRRQRALSRHCRRSRRAGGHADVLRRQPPSQRDAGDDDCAARVRRRARDRPSA